MLPPMLRPFVRTAALQLRGCRKSEIKKAVQFYKSFHNGHLADGASLVGIETKVPTNYEMAKRLIKQVWPSGEGKWKVRRTLIYAMGLLVSAKLLNACVPFVLRSVIDHYNQTVPAGMALSLDSAASTILSTGVLLILAYGFARTGTSLFNELRNAVFANVAQRSIRTISLSIFRHLHNLDLSFHLNRQTGGLAKAIDRGTTGMSFTLSALVFNLLPTAFEIALVEAIFLKTCGVEFAALTAGSLGMYAIATIGITRWRTKFRQQMNAADNEAGNRAIDSLINYETVKYFNNEKLEADRYDFHLQQFEGAALKTSKSLALLNFTQNAIFSAGLVGVMYLAARNVANGTMTVGDIILANTLLFQMSIPLNFLGSVYREVRQGLLDMQTMFALLNVRSQIVEKPDALPLVTSPDTSTISFKDVTFSYGPNQTPILNKLSFEVPAGKKVAIIGGSGSGKSTIVRLLYRLYDVGSGSISIGDQIINDVTLESLRKAIAIVPQDTVLFHDTLYYNIQYGNPQATDEQVKSASKLADLHRSVIQMPFGYETIVGERGLKLSGGEKQRVSIARAHLKNTNIVIYDEATSSLDALTEETIMESLKVTCRGKTTLVIAHRLATVVDSDIIYVLEGGRAVEAGNHEELLQKGGKYAELWNSQHRYGVAAKPKKLSKAEEMLQIEMEKCCGSGNCNR